MVGRHRAPCHSSEETPASLQTCNADGGWQILLWLFPQPCFRAKGQAMGMPRPLSQACSFRCAFHVLFCFFFFFITLLLNLCVCPGKASMQGVAWKSGGQTTWEPSVLPSSRNQTQTCGLCSRHPYSLSHPTLRPSASVRAGSS